MNDSTASPAAPPTITVVGHAERFVKPDRVTFRFTLSLVAPSVREAEASLLRQRTQLLNALTPLLPPGRQVESAGLHLGPHHVYENHRHVFKGFEATECLSLRLPLGPDTTRNVLHAVADQLDSIDLRLHYSAKCHTSATEAARTGAVHDARQKATQFAAAADQQLGRLLRLTDHVNDSNFRVEACTTSELAGDPDAAPESISVSATIRAVWELVPA